MENGDLHQQKEKLLGDESSEPQNNIAGTNVESPVENLNERSKNLVHSTPSKTSEKTGLSNRSNKQGTEQSVDIPKETQTDEMSGRSEKCRIERMCGWKTSYQKLALAVSAMVLLMSVMPLSMLSYAAPEPQPFCRDQIKQDWKSCTEKEACKKIDQGLGKIEFRITNSWTQDLKVYCDGHTERKLGKSLFVVSSSSFSLISLLFADKIGRKRTFDLIALFLLVGTLGMCFSKSFILKITFLGIAGASGNTYGTIFTIFLCELIPEKSPLFRMIVPLMFTFFPLGTVVVNTVAFINPNYTNIFYLGVGSVALFFWMPSLFFYESTEFLVSHPTESNIKKALEIAKKINKNFEEPSASSPTSIIERSSVTTLEENSSKNPNKHPSFWKILKQVFGTKQLLVNLVTMCVFGSFITTLYIGIMMDLDSLGSNNTELNGIIYSSIQVLSSSSSYFLIGKLDYKKWIIGSQYIILGGLVGLVVLYQLETSLIVTIFRLFFAILAIGSLDASSFTPFYYMMSDLFPVSCRGFSSSMIIFLSNIFAMTSQAITPLCEALKIPYIVGCGLTIVLSLPLSYFLKKWIESDTKASWE